MKLLSLRLLSIVSAAAATGPVPVSRSGLAGINGFTFYEPYCAHGCFRSFAGLTLNCSMVYSPGGHSTSTHAAHELALCRASDFPYLSSIAWCVHQYCADDVRASTIETFWETQITGDISVLPEWTYGELMANITQPPTVLRPSKTGVLNTTMITTRQDWDATQLTLIYFYRETVLESYYGLAICLTAFALPIVTTWLGYLPYATGILGRIKPWLYPSIIGTLHDRPLPFLLGNAPTIGQSFYIAILVILNIILVAVGYETLRPDRVNQWDQNRYQELMEYVMYRTGVLAFCHMPVLFLFSSRNNILLWMTNLSHSSYLLFHRWIARIFLFHTLVHSILALQLYQNKGSYAKSLPTLWWIWGCVGTIAAVIIVLTSVLVLRQRAYELFLVTHVVMSVICVAGCWYHVWYGYENTFGYETWLYAAVAVWFFDRIARVARILKTGFRHAELTDIGSSIVRVDIPGIRWASPGQCVYAYFPTLRPLRPWENHPFSTIPTAMLNGWHKHSDHTGSGASDTEKSGGTETASPDASVDTKPYTNSGLTLFVRKSAGMTRYLKAHKGLLTLLEGPYPTNPTKSVLESDRLLLIGGGIGITGLLSFVRRHPNIKLFLSVKTADKPLVSSLSAVLDEVHEKEVRVGQRLDISALLHEEASLGWSKVAVVVCGPAGMCDDVRAAVAQLGKKSRDCSFELEVDSFSW